MAKIRITNLRLRTIIGTHDWEREIQQDVVVNITLDYDATKAIASDDLRKTVDYKALTKQIVKEVEASRFFLLEKLSGRILDVVTAHPAVRGAVVRVDKPQALRFADSVSVELSWSRKAKAVSRK
ncbi:MAG: dihydroneopterin aldolase [Candidatus Omnitrophica bacterium]|nr:dihydroneopterin aldolase [Candidatus Omnitrophota bacterium]MBI5023530.1 dihydroneopterin aldolase [Candidatus Omnitrophota bacterium]